MATPISEAARKIIADLVSLHFNDEGNSQRLIKTSGHELRYCHAFKKWLIFDGMRWAVDDTDQARKLAKQAIFEFLRQAIESRNEQAEKFARASLDARRIGATLSMTEPELPIRPAELDVDPYALNFRNGTVDLRTRKLRPHRSSDFITKLVNFRYLPGAECPRFIRFLHEVLVSEGLVSFVQLALGYALTGVTSEKAVFVLHGAGDNGKSVLLSTFRQLIEEYSALLDIGTLLIKHETTNAQADLADLRGARFVQTSESEAGARLAQGKLKRITQGTGKIKAVRKYENPIEFSETHKLFIDTNKKPTIQDVDDRATLNRLFPIPFSVSIPSERIDRQLSEKLLSEAEGILAWAVEGARLWYKSGLQLPPEIDEARKAWRDESDQLARFIEDKCVTGDGFTCNGSALYATYRNWAEASGEHAITLTAFGTKLPERGFSKERTSRGVRYSGIAIRSEVSND